MFNTTVTAPALCSQLQTRQLLIYMKHNAIKLDIVPGFQQIQGSTASEVWSDYVTMSVMLSSFLFALP